MHLRKTYPNLMMTTSIYILSQLNVVILSLSCFSMFLGFVMYLWRRRTFPRVKKNGMKVRVTESTEVVEVNENSTTSTSNGSSNNGGNEWTYDVATSLGRLAVILIYFFLCDRYCDLTVFRESILAFWLVNG